jgi:hypothetical protein
VCPLATHGVPGGWALPREFAGYFFATATKIREAAGRFTSTVSELTITPNAVLQSALAPVLE